MKYEVVFDAPQQGYSWWVPIIGLFFLAQGIFMWKYSDKFAEFAGPFSLIIKPKQATAFMKGWLPIWAVFAMLFGSCATCGIFALTYAPYAQARQILASGEATVVEGVVENLEVRRGTERFTVGSVRFSYSDASVSPGFHSTSDHGGPIREGIYVRIHYTYIEGDPYRGRPFRADNPQAGEKANSPINSTNVL